MVIIYCEYCKGEYLDSLYESTGKCSECGEIINPLFIKKKKKYTKTTYVKKSNSESFEYGENHKKIVQSLEENKQRKVAQENDNANFVMSKTSKKEDAEDKSNKDRPPKKSYYDDVLSSTQSTLSPLERNADKEGPKIIERDAKKAEPEQQALKEVSLEEPDIQKEKKNTLPEREVQKEKENNSLFKHEQENGEKQKSSEEIGYVHIPVAHSQKDEMGKNQDNIEDDEDDGWASVDFSANINDKQEDSILIEEPEIEKTSVTDYSLPEPIKEESKIVSDKINTVPEKTEVYEVEQENPDEEELKDQPKQLRSPAEWLKEQRERKERNKEELESNIDFGFNETGFYNDTPTLEEARPDLLSKEIMMKVIGVAVALFLFITFLIYYA